MRWSNAFAPSLVMACALSFAGPAWADPVELNAGPFAGLPPSPETPSFPAVLANDDASMGLKVYANPSVSGFVNQGGDAIVRRGGSFANVGTGGAYGSYNVLATWDEFVGANTNIVQAIWKTSNSQRFIPVGATVGGLPVQFVEWRLGVADPVSFGPWVSGNTLISATIGSSTNGGQTFQNFDITASLTSPWNGTAAGTTLPLSFFAAANYIQLTVEFTPIPAPSALALGVPVVLMLSRRRRCIC